MLSFSLLLPPEGMTPVRRSHDRSNQPARQGRVWCPPAGVQDFSLRRCPEVAAQEDPWRPPYDLINYIVVELIVKGRRGFSELERSILDGARGKRLWAVGETNLAPGALDPALAPGKLTRPSPGVEQLDVAVRVEPFDNGARMYSVVSQ